MSTLDFGVDSNWDSAIDMGFNDKFDSGVIIMFYIVTIIVVIGFLIVFVLVAINLYKACKIKKKNDNSPRITVTSKVVSKRTDISYYNSGVNSDFNDRRTSTKYYAAFEVESGDRMELEMSGSDFGILVEGDEGRLTFQGTRYISFERQSSN